MNEQVTLPLPPVVLDLGGRVLGYSERDEAPTYGEHIALEDLSGGWARYLCTGRHSWSSTSGAAFQAIPNAVPEQLQILLEDDTDKADWLMPQEVVAGVLLSCNGQPVTQTVHGFEPRINELWTHDDEQTRRRFRCTGIRRWFGDPGVHTSGSLVFRRLVSEVLLTQIRL